MDRQEEEKYLETTKSIIKETIKNNKKTIEEEKKRIVKEKRHLYHNIHEMTDAEMYNTMDEEDLNVDLLNNLIRKNISLSHSLETPYFGRVDFKTDETDKLYIGLTSVSKDYDYYVYDWRAPISNLYYNFEKGKASFESPNGEITGEITLKRQYQIKMGQLKNFFDSDITIDDTLLQDVLISSRDDKMKNIVSTIQKEQNEVIRYRGKSNLVIEGVAGSGKTSVALHRVAYLLYNEKELTSKNIVIFSPNDIFSEYISDVLPELGEENAKTVTFSSFIKDIDKKIKVESFSDALNRYYTTGIDDDIIKLKKGENYLELLKAYLTYFVNSINFHKSMGLKKVKITSDELNELLHTKYKRLSISDRIDKITSYVLDKFEISEDKNFEKLKALLIKDLNIDSDIVTIYNNFLEYNKLPLITDTVYHEDIVGMLYLYYEIYGYPIVSHIKHIVIDEAQDYTPIEFRFLNKIYKNAIFTILGDKNQRVNPYYKYDSLEILCDIFKDSKYIKLSKTYRSTPEIINFSNKILGLKNIKSIRNSNNLDVIVKNESDLKDDLLKDLDYFKENGFNRCAIITKTKDESEKIYNLVKNKNISLGEESILKDITILPVYLAKGLEFDAVIVYTSKEDEYDDLERSLYYVSTTRATNALIVYNQK